MPINMQDWHPIPELHRSPYPRISPSHPGRKNRITLEEWLQSGAGREPDPNIYHWNGIFYCWTLKEGA